ncbi:MAG TPA: cytochrome C oxidase subunit IV family protein [Pyrinomonadaceae bacterium]|nr:cytochrome C oxidase subunit IV family protein [Pyrinomonadaceae bacterium]
MEKQQTSTDVSQLIATSMRPFDADVEARRRAGQAPHGGGSASGRRFSPVRNLLNQTDIVLNIICLLFALGFLALAVRSAGMAGSFLTIDNLFLIAVCLMLAGIFMVSPALMAYERGWHTKFLGAGGTAEVFEEDIHFEGSTKLFLSVLGGLLLLTLVEVVLAYFQVPLAIMLTILIGLSLIKAAMIVAYFMHLRFERLSLVLTLIPILVVCICLLFIFFPDSNRSLNLRSTQASAVEATESHGETH